jgi:ElaB/YqjD/DUF883 family membrane-anchored ribosome-binding protein
MTATDQLRTVLRDLEAKAKELELDKKLATFADQADHYLRVAATRAGDFAAENRERVEATLDKAGSKVDEKTDGKYHSYVGKVRAGVLTGVDWVAEQRETPASTDADAPAGAGATAGAGGTASATPTDSTTTSTSSTEEGAATTSSVEDAADVVPPGSADSDAWVDVTDTPPATHDAEREDPTDPR